MKESKLSEDIAVIKNEIKNLNKSFDEFKEEYKALSDRVSGAEAVAIKTSERVSGLAIFQSLLSVIIGAIATYLGARR